MRKNRTLGLWLIAGALCLGGCGLGNGGGDKTETAVEKEEESGAEKEGLAGNESLAGEESIPGETRAEEDIEKAGEPSLLTLANTQEYDNVWEDGRLFCHTSYLKLWLDGEAFPRLSQALEEMNAQTGKYAGETMAELEAQAREMAAYGSAQDLSWEEDTWVVRADSQALSLLKRSYTYTGGAHGFYGFTGITFDPESGRQLELEEIVTDTGRLVELAGARLAEKYPDVDFFEEPVETLKKELEEGYLTWTAGYEGLTLYFAPYELAPYASGMQAVTILYGEEPDLFDEGICQVPGMWASQLAPGLEFDLGHDGKVDSVEVAGIMDEYGSAYINLVVSVNEQESLLDTWIYRYNSYLVSGEALDTELLVTETWSDNDYQIMGIWELDPEREGFWEPWQFPGTGLSGTVRESEDGNEEYGAMLLTNPGHFCLSARFQLLSTYTGKQWGRIDKEARDAGYVALDQPWYDVDRGDYYLTLLVPLEMETGETRELQVYPEGTKLWIIRVEGEDCVVFSTEDQIICRVYVESSEWPARVRGVEDMNVDDIFDGMMFAG